MKISAQDLKNRYSSLYTDELLQIERDGNLTELAKSVLKEELRKRGITDDSIRKAHQDKTEEMVVVKKSQIRLGKHIKIFIGILTCLPITCIVLLPTFIILFRHAVDFGGFFESYPHFLKILSHFLSFIALGLLLFYMIYLLKNNRIQNKKKTLWAVILLLGFVFTMPVFWYLYIWREQKEVEKKYEKV